jgi:hypothetical protein
MDNLTFWQAALIAGIALIGPLVAGLVAMVVARLQIESRRNQSVRDSRREKIEEAVALVFTLESSVADYLVDWIESGQQAERGLASKDHILIQAATEAIRRNPLAHTLPDRAGRASMLFKLYMPDCENEITNILAALKGLMADDRAKGKDPNSAPLLARELMIDFSTAIQTPVSGLLEKARKHIQE